MEMRGTHVFFITLVIAIWLWVGYDTINTLIVKQYVNHPIHITWIFLTSIFLFLGAGGILSYIGESIFNDDSDSKLAKFLDKYFGV
jgi:hypothetical protein